MCAVTPQSGTNRTLEENGDVGYYTSVAIGADGNPIIRSTTAPTIWSCTCARMRRARRTNRNSLETGDVGFSRRLRSGPTATRSSATGTTPTTIWSCTCAAIDAACTSGTNDRTLETGGCRWRRCDRSGGNPIIGHFDGINGDLELYVCEDAACGARSPATSAGTRGCDRGQRRDDLELYCAPMRPAPPAPTKRSKRTNGRRRQLHVGCDRANGPDHQPPDFRPTAI